MAVQTNAQSGLKASTVIATIAALIAIIGFIFGVTKWGDIQQYFWRQQVVGTWQDEYGHPMRFYDDGTFTAGGILPANGDYMFSDSDTLIIRVSGLLGIMGTQVIEVEFVGNTMYWLDSSRGLNTSFSKVR